MTTSEIRDVSNLACVGFEFTDSHKGFNDITWQFVFYPGVVAFGTKHGDRPWSHSTVTAPERFGQLPAGYAQGWAYIGEDE